MGWVLLGALVIGVTLGMLGSGGSAITVPVLVYLVGHGTKESIAESMAIVGLISVAAAIPYARAKQIDWRSVWWFGIPGMLGTFVGAGLTLGVMLFDWQGWWVFAAVAGVFVVLHLLEAGFLTPKIVGKKVGLGELGALFAVLAGGKLLGFAGVLLAVPIAASIAVLVRRALRYYERTEFFNEGAELARSGGHSLEEEE